MFCDVRVLSKWSLINKVKNEVKNDTRLRTLFIHATPINHYQVKFIRPNTFRRKRSTSITIIYFHCIIKKKKKKIFFHCTVKKKLSENANFGLEILELLWKLVSTSITLSQNMVLLAQPIKIVLLLLLGDIKTLFKQK